MNGVPPLTARPIHGGRAFDGRVGAEDRFEVLVNAATYPQLSGHRIAVAPVVPAVLVMEWFFRAAAACFPELTVRTCRDVKVLRGVVVDGFEQRGVRLVVRARVLESTPGSAKLELRLVDDSERPRYAGVVEMGASAAVAPAGPAARGAREPGGVGLVDRAGVLGGPVPPRALREHPVARRRLRRERERRALRAPRRRLAGGRLVLGPGARRWRVAARLRVGSPRARRRAAPDEPRGLRPVPHGPRRFARALRPPRPPRGAAEGARRSRVRHRLGGLARLDPQISKCTCRSSSTAAPQPSTPRREPAACPRPTEPHRTRHAEAPGVGSESQNGRPPERMPRPPARPAPSVATPADRRWRRDGSRLQERRRPAIRSSPTTSASPRRTPTSCGLRSECTSSFWRTASACSRASSSSARSSLRATLPPPSTRRPLRAEPGAGAESRSSAASLTSPSRSHRPPRARPTR